MGKGRRHTNRSGGGNTDSTASGTSRGKSGRRGTANSTASTTSKNKVSSSSQASPPKKPPFEVAFQNLKEWVYAERQGIMWVLGCVLVGSLFGFGLGSGLLTGATETTAWRVELGTRIRSTAFYRILTLKVFPWDSLSDSVSDGSSVFGSSAEELHPSHPLVFAVLREAVVREKGGYVHPDLGIMEPAPCGASRGLGMVRDSYHDCQKRCLPGTASEKLHDKNLAERPPMPRNKKDFYKQEELLVRVPLNFQMTRRVALDTLIPRLPGEVQRKANPNDLDDAALLVLLLAHERGVGRNSRWLPYIASLPTEPSCGYSKEVRPFMLDAISALRDEVGLDVYGWAGELMKASQHAARIVNGLSKDYGQYIKSPDGMSAYDNIKWALCQVASRATGGAEKHGALRLVPVLDMINHDVNAGGFTELTGQERLGNGDFVDATEEDSGTFVVRSIRHGRRKALKKGQELLSNYNVPHYSPLDWFVSLGFVPPERWNKWQKIDPALPRIRRDGPFAAASAPSPPEDLPPGTVTQPWNDASDAAAQGGPQSNVGMHSEL